MMQKSVYTHDMDGSETIEINQVRVTSNNDGTIRWIDLPFWNAIETLLDDLMERYLIGVSDLTFP